MQRGTKCAENYDWHGRGNICGLTRLNMDSVSRYKFAMIQETIKHIILSSHKVTVWGKYDYTTGAGNDNAPQNGAIKKLLQRHWHCSRYKFCICTTWMQTESYTIIQP